MQTTDHGTVTYDGLIYRLTQQAYVDNRATGVKYYAHATGPDGEPYLVVWDTTEAWDDHQDGGYFGRGNARVGVPGHPCRTIVLA